MVCGATRIQITAALAAEAGSCPAMLQGDLRCGPLGDNEPEVLKVRCRSEMRIATVFVIERRCSGFCDTPTQNN